MKKLRIIIAAVIAFTAGWVSAQERFSPFVPSDQESVERMLKLADLKDDDVVVDLGSGDGRIVLTAARMNKKLRGWGVDVDAKLVREANEKAKAEGLADRVQFFHRNAFDADLREATVIAMWLWPEMQRMLRPIVMAQARAGTRVISNLWDLGNWWPADREDLEGSRVVMLVVPARIEGYWNWELTVSGRKVPYTAVMEQRFQVAEGVVRAANRRELLNEVKLRGEDLSFSTGLTVDGVGFVRHEFRGKVRGDLIVGTVTISLPPEHKERIELPWRAVRGATSAYFDQNTGTNIQ